MLLSCLIPTSGFASEHMIEFKSELRGATFCERGHSRKPCRE
ncbi:hypothetical protein VCR12J2_140001 [Vibrio coralliirubri]|nr:hypothetical protein VCR12J2_140001 [Vibrio coralliirubri]